MLSLDKLKVRGGLSRRPPPSPVALPSAMAGFEMIGDREIRSSLEFRRDRSSATMVAMFALLVVVIIFGLWFVSFSKQEAIRGYVTATTGVTTLTTRFTGVIAKVWVAQGERVTKGQKLVTIRREQAVNDGAALTETSIEAMRQQRANLVAEVERLDAFLAGDGGDRAAFDRDQQALEASLAEQERQVLQVIAEQDALVARIKRQVDQGYATRETLTRYQQTAIEYARQLSEIRIRRTELGASLVDRRRSLDLTATDASNRRAELQNQIQTLDVNLRFAGAEGEVDILSPVDAQVATLHLREGSSVTEKSPVVSLAAPDAPILIALAAQSKSVGLINVGDRVVLKYDAFPYKTFGIHYGTVASVSKSALNLPPLPGTERTDPREPPQSNFLVEVVPERTTIDAYGEERPILIGSTLTADVVVERRRLIEWVLDPIFALRGRL